jgi:RNase P subunit RPR2
MEIKYEYKHCDECGNKENFEWRGCGGFLDGDNYTDLLCKDCGKKIRVYYRAKEESESKGYYHDGGWYRDNK